MNQSPFYSRPQYFQHLTSFASAAGQGDAITIATMGFKPAYQPVNGLVRSLIGAAQRGAQVTLLVDAFSFMNPDGLAMGPLWYSWSVHHSLSRRFRHKAHLLGELRAAGATVIITNQPGRALSNPVAGRSHIKFALLNDDVFIGGCNLTNPHHVDVMQLRQNDAQLATILRDFVSKVQAQPRGSVRAALGGADQLHTLHDGSTLIIDAGQRKVSSIERHALQLITGAQKEVFITLQYPPYGLLARALDTLRHANVRLQLLYNAPQRFAGPSRVLMAATSVVMAVRTSSLLAVNTLRGSNKYMHAKVLVVDSMVMVGSHNYVNAGVRFGTAEIAIISSDTTLAQQAMQCIRQQL